MKNNRYEYRVRWRREDGPVRSKLYTQRPAAEKFMRRLVSGGEWGVLVEVELEVREVGPWQPC